MTKVANGFLDLRVQVGAAQVGRVGVLSTGLSSGGSMSVLQYYEHNNNNNNSKERHSDEQLHS